MGSNPTVSARLEPVRILSGSRLDRDSASGTALPAGAGRDDAVKTVMSWLRMRRAPDSACRMFVALAEVTPDLCWTSPHSPAPANWRLLVNLADDAGISERSARRGIQVLAGFGLIEIRTALNGRRGECGGGGWQGISLGPALARFESVREEVRAGEARIRRFADALRRTRVLLSRCQRALTGLDGREERDIAARIGELRRDAVRIAGARKHGPLAEDRLAALQAAAGEIGKSVKALEENKSGAGAEAGESVEESVEKPVESSPDAVSGTVDPSGPPVNSTDGPLQRESGKEDRGCSKSGEKGSLKDAPEVKSAPGRVENVPEAVRSVMSRDFEAALARAAESGCRGEARFSIGARLLCGRIGISRHAWSEAVAEMGDQALVALAVLDRNRFNFRNPVRSPGGYLRGMTRRSREGELDLAKSVEAIKNRAERAEQPRRRIAARLSPLPG